MQTSQILYGSSSPHHTVLPIKLNSLASYFGKSSSDLLNDHTLFPYYKCFITRQEMKDLKSAIRNEKPINNLFFDLYVKQKTRLCICPICLEEDIQQVGEPYWHRSHHLPGTLVCHKHNVRLFFECPECKEAFHSDWNPVFKITPIFCSNNHSLIEIIYNIDGDLLLIAKENNDMLLMKRYFEISEIREKLKIHSRLKGYLNINSTVIKFQKLYPDFISRFSKDLLETLSLSLKTEIKNNWLKPIFGERSFFSSMALRPLQFILCMIFFAGSTKSFFKNKLSYFPFGRGPWPCLNGACKFFKQHIIDEIVYENSTTFGIPNGIFHCRECGFVYTRNGSYKDQDDPYEYSHIRQTGQVWNEAFEELLQGEVVIVTNIAEKLNVRPSYIKLRIKDRLQEINLIKSRKVDTKKVQRRRLIKVMKEIPILSRSEMNKEYPSLMHWLQVHDKEWLDSNLPLESKNEIETKRNIFLKVLAENQNASRTKLRRTKSYNYKWLFKNDTEWLMKHLPPSKRRERVSKGT